MQTKEDLVYNVREWVLLENKMRDAQKLVRELRKTKKELTANLIEVMKEHEVDAFSITTGSIVYKENKIKAPLSRRHLLKALSEYFKDDPLVSGEITNHILNTRDVKTVESIEYKLNK
jgi:hypothetical protein